MADFGFTRVGCQFFTNIGCFQRECQHVRYGFGGWGGGGGSGGVREGLLNVFG